MMVFEGVKNEKGIFERCHGKIRWVVNLDQRRLQQAWEVYDNRDGALSFKHIEWRDVPEVME